MWQNAGVCRFWLKCVGATVARHSSTSELQKVGRTHGVLYILTYTCASRHSGTPFFDIATSKNDPKLRYLVHFDLKMCFAPKPRAIFWHRNFKNRSEPEVLCAFWLENALRATAASHFSTSQLQKLARECGVLCILTWKFASRHSGVPFSRRCWTTSAPTAGFSDPTCRTSRATNHWKNTAIRGFPNIWRPCIFFLVTLLACWSSFFWLDFSGLLFNCPYCRKVDF